MSDNNHVTKDLAAYALGALDQEEAAAVSLHLAQCELCRAELRAYQAIVNHLPFSAPLASPPLELKERLMARVREKQSPRMAPTPWLDRMRHWLQKPTPAWQLGLASALLVIVVAVSLFAPGAEPTDFGQIVLAATENARGATGILIVSADGEYGSLVVQGLLDLTSAQQYQLWLIDDSQRASGGVFSVHDGYAAIQVYSRRPLSSYQAFVITIEPAGGSPSPTGTKVLGST